MKNLLLIPILFLILNTGYAQHSIVKIKKQDLTADSLLPNFKLAGEYLIDAGSNLELSFYSIFLGNLVTGFLAYITYNHEKKEFELYAFLPALIGDIAGVVAYLSGASDLKEAGRLLRKVKR